MRIDASKCMRSVIRPFQVAAAVGFIAVCAWPAAADAPAAVAASDASDAGNASALTLDTVMEAALANDASLADARSRLKIAENARARSAPLYGSSLGLSGSVSGNTGSSSTPVPSSSSGGGVAGDAVRTSVGANLSIPLAKWISLAAEGTTDLSSVSGTVSLSVNPFAQTDTSADTAWKKAMIEAQSAVRTTILAVRKEYRALVTARSEYEYRKSSVRTAENELSRIGYLVELGKDRKSKEISAYGDLMEAQGNLDSALNNVNSALQALSARTGLSEAALDTLGSDYDPGSDAALSVNSTRMPVDEELWTASSAELAIAVLNLAQQKATARSSVTKPGLSLGASVTDSASWSLTAKVSFSPDLLFQKNADTAAENLAIQERSLAKTEQNVRTAWKNQQNALSMAERNFSNAQRFFESAQLSYEETELLFDRGESSQANLDEAQEKLLSARWQLIRSAESLENARDQLDAAWQLSIQ